MVLVTSFAMIFVALHLVDWCSLGMFVDLGAHLSEVGQVMAEHSAATARLFGSCQAFDATRHCYQWIHLLYEWFSVSEVHFHESDHHFSSLQTPNASHNYVSFFRSRLHGRSIAHSMSIPFRPWFPRIQISSLCSSIRTLFWVWNSLHWQLRAVLWPS